MRRLLVLAVNIQFALSQGKLIHISERLSRENKYTCPSCMEAVIARKGNINTHHFAHKPNSSCSANEETMLHYFAKHYLASNKDENIAFQFPTSFFHTIKGISTAVSITAEIKYVPIRLNHILDYFSTDIEEGKVERPIGNFVADVLFTGSYEDSSEFVIEIFVTHSMEDQKRNYFVEENIPYIEVSPSINNEVISFFVTDMFLPDFIENYEKEIKDNLLHFAYREFREELMLNAKKELYNYDQALIQKELALLELKEDLDNINFRDYIDRNLYKKMISIPASSSNNFDSLDRVRDIRMKKRYLFCNNLFVNYESRILHSLLYNFMDEGIEIEALIEKNQTNNKNAVTGFNFTIPSTKVTGTVMKDILKDMITKLEKNKQHSIMSTKK